MRKQPEIPKDIDPIRPVEYTTYLPNQDKPFVIAGDYADVLPHVKPVEAVQPAKLAKTRNVAAVATEAAVAPPLPVYVEPSFKQKYADWKSDRPWVAFDRKYGTDIAHTRKAQRVAKRILVARIAAGVEAPPKWTKYRTALALAEKALSER